jgi:hypothetical protein
VIIWPPAVKSIAMGSPLPVMGPAKLQQGTRAGGVAEKFVRAGGVSLH